MSILKKFMSAALAIFLSLAVLFTFTPLTGTTYAASKASKVPKVSVTKTTGTSVTLSWGKVKKAKGFKVYKKVGEKYKVVAKTKNLKVTVKGLKQETAYKFKVRAAKKKNYRKLGKSSNVVKAKTTKRINVENQTIAKAEKIYAKSATGLETAEDIAYNLAYNKKFWDSNEGFRNAGSDAEHKAANYLAKEWKDIGLTDVTIDEVELDKWQFNDANLAVTVDGSNVVELGFTDKEDESVISYAASGTKQAEEAGTVEKGFYDNDLDIVYCGNGTLDSLYALGLTNGGLKDKIALVGIDQWNNVWITQAYNECYTQGAVAVIAYNTGGYANYSEDANHVQDICSDDLGIPCVDISKENGEKIKKAITKEYSTEDDTYYVNLNNATAKLYVDNEIDIDNGKTYNVVGKIKGTGNTGQQIIYAGHYDKYFYGYEDDCLATGLVGGIAKAMVESGYKPENDIIFIAHGAEEWGQSGTEYDWAIGSYKEIQKHPEWQGTTLAYYNFELPGIRNGAKQVVASSFEANSIVNETIGNDSKLVENAYRISEAEANYTGAESAVGLSYADTIGYEQYGIPVYMNYTLYEKTNETAYTQKYAENPGYQAEQEYGHKGTWSWNRYHTQYDTINEDAPEKKTSGYTYSDGVYSSELMQQQICYWSALGVAQDQKPALVLDFANRYDQLYDAMFDDDGNCITEAATEKQVTAYKNALDNFKKAAADNKSEGNAINADYVKAMASGDYAAANKAKKQAKAYNKKSLAAFGAIQDELISIDCGSYSSDVTHTLLEANYELFNSASKAQSKYAINYYAYQADGLLDWSYGCQCTEKTLKRIQSTFTNDSENWGKSVMMVDGLEDTLIMANRTYLAAYYGVEDYDINYFHKQYRNFANIAKSLTQKYVTNETKSINNIADAL